MENKNIDNLFKILESPKQKIMITLPEEVLKKLDTHAKKLHYTRSRAITNAVFIWLQIEDAIEKEKKNENN